jgi:uncharacterized protein
MKAVCIAGARGFIGINLAHRLKNEGYDISAIGREDFQNGNIEDKIRNCSIVINLVGESIAGLWTKKKRKKIYESRVLTTKKLIGAINTAGNEVKLLIQVSGVGIYDNQNLHTEESKLYDKGFLSQVILDWEGELVNLERPGLRVVILRLGVVLDKSGGFLKQLLYPLKAGIGIGIRSEEYFPYIALEDLMRIFVFCLESKSLNGIVNVTAPALTKINHFFREVARIKKCRVMIWFNSSFIRFFMGEAAGLVTNGQRVIPQKLLSEGYVFKEVNIEDALNRACN